MRRRPRTPVVSATTAHGKRELRHVGKLPWHLRSLVARAFTKYHLALTVQFTWVDALLFDFSSVCLEQIQRRLTFEGGSTHLFVLYP